MKLRCVRQGLADDMHNVFYSLMKWNQAKKSSKIKLKEATQCANSVCNPIEQNPKVSETNSRPRILSI